jgi:hypothetical protein
MTILLGVPGSPLTFTQGDSAASAIITKSPQKLVKMNSKERFNLLLDFVSEMEEKGHAGNYIQSTLKAVKSWLVHNRIELKGKIKVKGT